MIGLINNESVWQQFSEPFLCQLFVFTAPNSSRDCSSFNQKLPLDLCDLGVLFWKAKFDLDTKTNKHCEIFVSSSDKERNCIQAHETAYKLMELHVRSKIFKMSSFLKLSSPSLKSQSPKVKTKRTWADTKITWDLPETDLWEKDEDSEL